MIDYAKRAEMVRAEIIRRSDAEGYVDASVIENALRSVCEQAAADAELTSLRARCAELENALKWYGERAELLAGTGLAGWPIAMQEFSKDAGAIARAALKSKEGVK